MHINVNYDPRSKCNRRPLPEDQGNQRDARDMNDTRKLISV